MKKASKLRRHRAHNGDPDIRDRILEAAFAAFMERGYGATSTLEIATRARVSKRELYAQVGNKQQMLVACIRKRAQRFAVPTQLPMVRSSETLERVLIAFGTKLVHEISDPAVLGVFRLAIAEANRAPEVAQAVDSIGREASRAALRNVMAEALESGLLIGSPVELAEQFGGLLWRDLMVSLLLGVRKRPTSPEIAERAQGATAAFLRLHSPENKAT